MADYTRAHLPDSERAVLDFTAKLTRTPAAMTADDVAALRQHDFTDEAIHDITQITALFNYYNRLADGLGLDHEAHWSSN